MGCVNSFIYKSKNFAHIDWYSEKIDKRLGEIYLIKSSKSKTNYISKEISNSLRKKLERRKKIFDEAFKKTPEFLLLIIGFDDSCERINCEQKKNQKN